MLCRSPGQRRKRSRGLPVKVSPPPPEGQGDFAFFDVEQLIVKNNTIRQRVGVMDIAVTGIADIR